MRVRKQLVRNKKYWRECSAAVEEECHTIIVNLPGAENKCLSLADTICWGPGTKTTTAPILRTRIYSAFRITVHRWLSGYLVCSDGVYQIIWKQKVKFSGTHRGVRIQRSKMTSSIAWSRYGYRVVMESQATIESDAENSQQVYLQHGGVYYLRQNDVIVTPCYQQKFSVVSFT